MMNATPQQPDLASTAWQLMQTFVEGQTHKARIEEKLQLGVGRGRVKVLFLLRQQSMTFGELADTHGVDRPSMTRIVDRLESLGYVETRAHPEDGRKKIVALTEAGQQAAATAERILGEVPAELQALSIPQLTQLTGILSQLR